MSITAQEQLLIEMINRARLDPLGEAKRFGINLNDDLDAGTISGQPMQVIAYDPVLAQAAANHSNWMLQNDNFSHSGASGSSPGDRMEAAGYNFTGSWTWGENIAWSGTTGTLDLTSAMNTHHEGLFKSAGHRVNILKASYQEIGVAQVQGNFDGYNASMLTQNFAKSGSSVFLTGVAYNDQNNNDFYSVGEGVSGVRFAVGGTGVSTLAAGGYVLELSPRGMTDVSVSRGGFNAEVRIDLSGGNVKLDLVDGNKLLTSGDMTLGAGAVKAGILGVSAIDLTGNGVANVLSGNAGRNVISGAGGNDAIYGGGGNDRINGGAGNDRVWGGNGQDVVHLGDGKDVFNDNGQGGTHGRDTVYAGKGYDIINCGGGNDAVYGGVGNDTIRGGGGDDRLYGGNCADTIYGNDGNDLVWGGNGRDVAYLGRGNDVFNDTAQSGEYGVDRVFGGAGNDRLVGGGGVDALFGEWGNDTMTGGSGADRLFGGDGADMLNGQAGADLLVGGAGADGFVFRRGYDNDTVRGFQDDVDTLRIDDGLWGGSSLTAAKVIDTYATASGGNVVFDFGGGDRLIIEGVGNPGDLLDDITFI